MKVFWAAPLLNLTWGSSTGKRRGVVKKGGRILEGRKPGFPTGGRVRQGQSITHSHHLPNEGRGKCCDGNAEGNGNRRRKWESQKETRQKREQRGCPLWVTGEAASPEPPHHVGLLLHYSPRSSGTQPQRQGCQGGGYTDPAPPRPSRCTEKRLLPPHSVACG